MVSPLLTVLSPPLNRPAESSVPPVLSMVLKAPVPKARKQPLTTTLVPLVMANASAAVSALEPAEAAFQPAAVVLRGAVYVGAFAPPASVQPACEAIVSAATGPAA